MKNIFDSDTVIIEVGSQTNVSLQLRNFDRFCNFVGPFPFFFSSAMTDSQITIDFSRKCSAIDSL